MNKKDLSFELERYEEYVRKGKRSGYDFEKALIALGGEMGEVFNASKKYLVYKDKSEKEILEYKNQIKDELGDVFWQWVLVCIMLEFSTREIIEYNIKKLTERYNDEY